MRAGFREAAAVEYGTGMVAAIVGKHGVLWEHTDSTPNVVGGSRKIGGGNNHSADTEEE